MRRFQCSICDERPDAEFTIFRADGEVEDWVIAYPSKQLIHIHFGTPTIASSDNIEEAKFIDRFLRASAAAHPKDKYYIVIDALQTDNSEFIPPESLIIYRDILKHPQFGDGAIYGGTSAFSAIINLLTLWSSHDIKIVETAEEAMAAYERWWTKGKRTV